MINSKLPYDGKTDHEREIIKAFILNEIKPKAIQRASGFSDDWNDELEAEFQEWLDKKSAEFDIDLRELFMYEGVSLYPKDYKKLTFHF